VGGSTYRVVALVPNLMDRGPVETAVRAAGAAVEFVADPAQLVDTVGTGACLAVVDLAVAGVMAAVVGISAGGTRTVGFASHIERAVLRRARDEGCDDVVPRSALARRLPQIVAAAVGAQRPGGHGGQAP
jgi:hypothetical protein